VQPSLNLAFAQKRQECFRKVVGLTTVLSLILVGWAGSAPADPWKDESPPVLPLALAVGFGTSSPQEVPAIGGSLAIPRGSAPTSKPLDESRFPSTGLLAEEILEEQAKDQSKYQQRQNRH